MFWCFLCWTSCLIRKLPELKDFYLVLFVQIKREALVCETTKLSLELRMERSCLVRLNHFPGIWNLDMKTLTGSMPGWPLTQFLLSVLSRQERRPHQPATHVKHARNVMQRLIMWIHCVASTQCESTLLYGPRCWYPSAKARADTVLLFKNCFNFFSKTQQSRQFKCRVPRNYSRNAFWIWNKSRFDFNSVQMAWKPNSFTKKTIQSIKTPAQFNVLCQMLQGADPILCLETRKVITIFYNFKVVLCLLPNSHLCRAGTLWDVWFLQPQKCT